MSDTEPYALEDAQRIVDDALQTALPRHRRWRALETLYRTGSLEAAKQVVSAGELPDQFDLAYDVVNMTLPHVNVMLASTVARDPVFLCTPWGGGPEAEDNAATADGVLAYFWHRARATSALRKATRDMVILGDGFLKVGWHHVEHREEVDDAEFESRFASLVERDAELAGLQGEPPTDAEKLVDQVDDEDLVIDVDEPFVEYVPPYDMLVPPDTVDIEDARWVAQRITLPIADIEANDAFADVELRPDTAGSGRHGHDDASEWRRRAEREHAGYASEAVGDTATFYEFYDMKARRLLVFQLGAQEPLFDDELGYEHGYPPFVHLRNYQASGTEFWGFGDVENIANLQQMLNELFTLRLENARRSGNKTFIDSRAMSEGVRSGIESDQADVSIPVDVPNGVLLGDMVHNVVREPLDNDVYAMHHEVEDYLRKVAGINDFQAGGVGADRMSATAAAVVDGVASLRAQDKVAEVELGGAGTATRMLLLCQEFLDEPRAVRISGEMGARWPEVDRTAIRGEFEVKVEGGSTQAENPHTRENRGLRTLNEIAPALEAAGYDPTPAIRQALRDLGYDPQVMLQPVPTPGEGGVPQEGAPVQGQPAGEPGEGAPADMTGFGGPPASLDAQMAGDVL